MKKTMIVVLVVAILFVTAGVVGSIVTNYNLGNRLSYDGLNYSRRGMMQNGNVSNQINTGEKMDFEALEELVESFISQYDERLVISDVFLFEDSDYYFSIMEEDTGLGAMELLVNPYTGDVYPEYGPNMMWNLKYGMHGGSGYGMMGNRGRGMMGRYSESFYSSDNNDFEKNTVTFDSAKQLASEYLDTMKTKDYLVSEEGHEFYGYYTFHIQDGNYTIGMLSVNGFTGEVWYHDWHGVVSEVVDGHAENDDH